MYISTMLQGKKNNKQSRNLKANKSTKSVIYHNMSSIIYHFKAKYRLLLLSCESFFNDILINKLVIIMFLIHETMLIPTNSWIVAFLIYYILLHYSF